MYETETSIFKFALNDVKRILETYIKEYQIDDYSNVLTELTSSNDDPIISLKDIDSFHHVIMDLIKQDKGRITCKPCKITYTPHDLQEHPLGLGKLPISPTPKISLSLFKNKYKRKPKMTTGFGGIIFLCPKGHELISIVTWIS